MHRHTDRDRLCEGFGIIQGDLHVHVSHIAPMKLLGHTRRGAVLVTNCIGLKAIIEADRLNDEPVAVPSVN